MAHSLIPLHVQTDRALGGRWVSLRSDNREWLWTNPRDEIVAARPGVDENSTFVDAGGGEECYPCVRAPYDHGLVWNRRWTDAGHGWEECEGDGYRLARRIDDSEGVVRVEYRADARTPREVLHATHLLLDLSEDAALEPVTHGPLLFWDPRPDAEIEALGGEEAYVRTIGQGEQSAVCYSITDCTALTVRDGDDALHFELSAARDDIPLGFVIWRNLNGWPTPPYRSLGIEPAIGRDVELPGTIPGGTVAVAPGYPAEWTLTIRATRG